MRSKKQFWAITEWNTVQFVEGLECGSGHWWVPSLGFTMTEGFHLFETEETAKSALRIKLNEKILNLQLALGKL